MTQQETPVDSTKTPDDSHESPPISTTTNWDQVQRLFALALALPIGEREAFLAVECAQSPQLRQQLERLLQANSDARQFMAGGANTADASGVSNSNNATGSIGFIGRYKLLQVIGEGGFGTVYMAEQQEPIRRRVALKLIKLGMDTRAVIARFDAERQALAMMDHPNIARVLDAGETENGRPYFVMELVNGIPLTQYCDNNRLTARERLQLFIPICQAVQHAHQKGIIHRDLKPSNVLITLLDGEPTPKVIDFGIAKATQARLTERTLFTELRQMIGTLQYMSPEQSEMSGMDVDTRSDIYSLGVMLYELLTGTTPLDGREMRRQAFDEMQRWIREVDPPVPSARVLTLARTESAVAMQRRTVFRDLQSLIHGDLDWVVMKCLEKNRSRRYDTAAGLAADLSRYLLNEPVSAAKPSRIYQAKKYFRRHRKQVVVVLIIACCLVGGAAGSTYGLVREVLQRRIAEAQRIEAIRQRSIADARFADVRQLANDLMFKFDDALVNVAGTTPARKMLADTALKYLDRLSQGSTVDPSLNRDLATSYMKVGDILGNPELPNVGETNLALASYQKCADLRQKLADADPTDNQAQGELCEIRLRLGNILNAKGQMDDAMSQYQNALEIARKRAKTEPANSAAQSDLAFCYEHIGSTHGSRGDSDQAIEDLKQALSIRQKVAADNPGDIDALTNLSVAYAGTGIIQTGNRQYDAALTSFQKSVDIEDKVVSEHPADARAQRNLSFSCEEVGYICTMKGQLDLALASYQRCLQINLKLAMDDPTNAPAQHALSNSYVRVAEIQKMTDRTEEALINFAKALEIRRKQAADDPDNVPRQGSLAQIYLAIGRLQASTQKPDEALVSLNQARQIFEKLSKNEPGHFAGQLQLVTTIEVIAEVLIDKDQLAQALAEENQAMVILQKLAVEHPDEARVKSALAEMDTDLSWGQLLNNDISTALQSAKAADALSANDQNVELKLAHALLFSNQPDRAKEVYLKHCGERIRFSSETWEHAVLDDFETLEKHGLTTPAMAEIRDVLNMQSK